MAFVATCDRLAQRGHSHPDGRVRVRACAGLVNRPQDEQGGHGACCGPICRRIVRRGAAKIVRQGLRMESERR